MKNTINKNDPIPRYLQVRRILEHAVRTGQYRPGSQLPGERELAVEMQVSQMTVNKAILTLVSDGWLRREIGRGTFVPHDFHPPQPAVLRIGFAIPYPLENASEDHYLGPLLRGIQRAVTNESVSLNLLETPFDSFYTRLNDASLDGFLLTDVVDECLADVRKLAAEGKRMVILSTERDSLPVPSVDSDNLGGAQEAMEHLISLGHRRIGGLFTYTDSSNSRQRLRAYTETLRKHGLDVPEDCCIALDRSHSIPDVLAAGIRAMLAKPDRPTAYFCGGYYIALETIQAAREAGVRIPEDLSVVGFDDPVSASYLTPPLTTVRQPLEEMGYKATHMLLRWLRHHEEPSAHKVLPARLKVRGSTAPPSAD